MIPPAIDAAIKQLSAERGWVDLGLMADNRGFVRVKFRRSSEISEGWVEMSVKMDTDPSEVIDAIKRSEDRFASILGRR